VLDAYDARDALLNFVIKNVVANSVKICFESLDMYLDYKKYRIFSRWITAKLWHKIYIPTKI